MQKYSGQQWCRDISEIVLTLIAQLHQTMLYMSAQSPSPWTFLTNLRQRIVQNYTKIEPGYAKVFRQTTVQRHIRDCVTISAVSWDRLTCVLLHSRLCGAFGAAWGVERCRGVEGAECVEGVGVSRVLTLLTPLTTSEHPGCQRWLTLVSAVSRGCRGGVG